MENYYLWLLETTIWMKLLDIFWKVHKTPSGPLISLIVASSWWLKNFIILQLLDETIRYIVGTYWTPWTTAGGFKCVCFSILGGWPLENSFWNGLKPAVLLSRPGKLWSRLAMQGHPLGGSPAVWPWLNRAWFDTVEYYLWDERPS